MAVNLFPVSNIVCNPDYPDFIMWAKHIQFMKAFLYQFKVHLVGIKCFVSTLAVSQNRDILPLYLEMVKG